MYVVIATVTCQGGTDFSGILTLKRLFDALAVRLSHLQPEKNFPNSPAKQECTVGTNAGVFLWQSCSTSPRTAGPAGSTFRQGRCFRARLFQKLSKKNKKQTYIAGVLASTVSNVSTFCEKLALHFPGPSGPANTALVETWWPCTERLQNKTEPLKVPGWKAIEKKHTMTTLKWPPTFRLSCWREKWSHLRQNAPPPI